MSKSGAVTVLLLTGLMVFLAVSTYREAQPEDQAKALGGGPAIHWGGGHG